MAKIQFADDNVGSAGLYELTYNPVEIDSPTSNPSDSVASIETVDGESISFYPYIDTRRGAMRWRGYRKDTSVVGAAFSAQLTVLLGYVGSYKYMCFGDLADALGIYPDVGGGGWKKIKVIAVNRSLRSGGGTVYDPVELIWEDVEE